MTDNTGLIGRLRVFDYDITHDAANALEAAQADLDLQAKAYGLAIVERDAAQAEIAGLEGSLDGIKCELQNVAAERDAALARIAEFEKRESVATVLMHEGEKIIDGSMAFMEAAPIGTVLYASPMAQPSQAREPIVWTPEQAYAEGRSAYECAQTPRSGWPLFRDIPPDTQAYWVALAAINAKESK